jgi:WD40 repeat protein
MASYEQGNDVALVGYDHEGIGFATIITVNQNATGYRHEYAESPITKSCFSHDGTKIALVNGKRVCVLTIKNNKEWTSFLAYDQGEWMPCFLYENKERTKSFTYENDVTELCFDPTNESLFVGLEDGSIYFSQLENAAARENDENYSMFLCCLNVPITLLSYISAQNILCAATLSKVKLFHFLVD